MDSTERSVMNPEESIQAKLEECRRIRERAAVNPQETGYADLLAECAALEHSIAAGAA